MRLDRMRRTLAVGLMLLVMSIAWLLAGGAAPATAQTEAPGTRFDHLSTGFPLLDAHARASCESCHQGGVLKGTPRDCASCHTAGRRLAGGNTVMPAQHVPSRQACDACHGTSTFVGARFRHLGIAPGTCASCHNGALASGKPGGHLPTSASCDSCHRSTAWSPATGFNHAGVVSGSCQGCHNGSRASGKPASHVPYTAVPVLAAAACDSCHRAGFRSWTPASVHASANLTTGCATCHTGAYPGATGKPANATHATVTGNCEGCHKSTATWGGARVDHASFGPATNCSSCHNGSGATGKPGTHIPTGAATCYACHGTTAWVPSKWNHTQVPVTAQCSSCHSGGYPPADGRPANHIPYAAVPVTAAANCDGCHKGSTSTWANGRVHANYAITTGCASCHTGSYGGAVGKPANATHATATGNCEGCHKSTTTWAGATFAHSPANAVGTGSCDGCHNGSTATGKPAGHIPVPAGAARCDSCHRSQSAWNASVTMNHTVVATATCTSCHGGAFTGAGATAKPANHIPEVQLLNGAAMDCNACHTGTTSWGALRMNHNNSPGNGAGWCKACHDRSTAWLGDMEKKSLTHKKSSGVTDCSQSGCHRPLGNKGSPYTKWD